MDRYALILLASLLGCGGGGAGSTAGASGVRRDVPLRLPDSASSGPGAAADAGVAGDPGRPPDPGEFLDRGLIPLDRGTLDAPCPQPSGAPITACADFWTCFDACPPGDTCCQEACRSRTAQPALAGVDAINECGARSCAACGSDATCVQQCAISSCTREVAACFCPSLPPPGSGSQGCASALTCTGDCAPTNTCCLVACAAKLSAPALTRLEALLRCLPSCGCPEGDQGCIQDCAGSFGGDCFGEGVACAQDR